MDLESSSEAGPACVICQGAMVDADLSADLIKQHESNLPLIQQLQYYNSSNREHEIVKHRPLTYIQLNCQHQFHSYCLIRWIHFDNHLCPLCRAPIDFQDLESVTWKLNNVAVRTRCSPESLKLGLKPEGWFNVQLQIVPPPKVIIHKVRYVFHPAFSLNKLDILQPPYDLVMKLVSNSVEVVVEVTLDDGKTFTFLHSLVKEMCTRIYYQDMYNGSDKHEEIKSLQYFDAQLELYKREQDYYTCQMPPPPRFANQKQQTPKRNVFQKLFGNLFQG